MNPVLSGWKERLKLHKRSQTSSPRFKLIPPIQNAALSLSSAGKRTEILAEDLL